MRGGIEGDIHFEFKISIQNHSFIGIGRVFFARGVSGVCLSLYEWITNLFSFFFCADPQKVYPFSPPVPYCPS